MNKDALKRYLQRSIHQLAAWTLQKYQPGIIAVTGSVGKTSAKEAIAVALRPFRKIRATQKNFNNELGVPLTILGDWQAITGKLFWLKVILASLWRLAFRSKYPELLVLEFAADKPGDIKHLVDLARPQIGVVTAIGEVPVHVEFYSGPEAVAREKAKIIETLPANGFAVLNYDDPMVREMKLRTRAHLITYGFSPEAEVAITNFEYRMSGNKPMGIAFKLNYAGSFVPVKLDDCFSKAQAYAAAAAAAVALAFGINLVKISEALVDYRVADGRGKIVPGIKQTYVIDDSYNASPLSVVAALETLKSFKAKRRVAVLGDMKEIGKYAESAHEKVGAIAAKTTDILITVGAHAKHIAAGARAGGLALKNIHSFDRADEAGLKVQELIKKGDLILIKASHSVGLSRIVEEIRQI